MPEGPEVRRYADEISKALVSKRITQISARTKNARIWLESHGADLVGKEVLSVFAHGKNVIGNIEGDYFFYSHQMMWGRWHVMDTKEAKVVDQRERARIAVQGKVALLMSAPIFEIGKGDPYKQIKYLKNLGPNVLPYNGKSFDEKEFQRRLEQAANRSRFIGSVLLDQSIVAGLGNYLRAEIMFAGNINPWTRVSELTKKQKLSLCSLVPNLAKRAYEKNGVTVTDSLQQRMRKEDNLVYVPGKEYGTHHYVFRRTNLPCLICDEKIRQLRQNLGSFQGAEDESPSEKDDKEKSRIVYFCPKCQDVNIDLAKSLLVT